MTASQIGHVLLAGGQRGSQLFDVLAGGHVYASAVAGIEAKSGIHRWFVLRGTTFLLEHPLLTRLVNMGASMLDLAHHSVLIRWDAATVRSAVPTDDEEPEEVEKEDVIREVDGVLLNEFNLVRSRCPSSAWLLHAAVHDRARLPGSCHVMR